MDPAIGTCVGPGLEVTAPLVTELVDPAVEATPTS